MEPGILNTIISVLLQLPKYYRMRLWFLPPWEHSLRVQMFYSRLVLCASVHACWCVKFYCCFLKRAGGVQCSMFPPSDMEMTVPVMCHFHKFLPLPIWDPRGCHSYPILCARYQSINPWMTIAIVYISREFFCLSTKHFMPALNQYWLELVWYFTKCS